MSKLKISVVSYLNSKPFIYGLQHSLLKNEIDLQLDIPSDCAKKLKEDTVDIGLLPVAVIPELKSSYIISDYCIGAVGKVTSVMLYSNVPLNDIEKVLLDYQSKTSVQLIQILAKNYWKINPEWESGSAGYEDEVKDKTAALVIGDRTFAMDNKYKYVYDLAEEWQKFTGLPFVFACWVSTKKLSDAFIKSFNDALAFGLDNRNVLVKELMAEKKYNTDIDQYLNKRISYTFDEPKKEALELFLNYVSDLGK